MALEIGTITEYMGRYGNEEIKSAVEESAKALQEIHNFNLAGEGGIDVFNVDRAFGHVANQADGGALVLPGGTSPQQGTQLVAIKRSAVQVPRATAHFTVKGAQASDLLGRITKAAGTALGRAFGRGFLNEKLCTLTAADIGVGGVFDTGVSTTGTLSEVAGIRAGDIVARYTVGNVLQEILLVTGAQMDPTGLAASVTIARTQHALFGLSAPPGVVPVAGDYLKLYTPVGSTDMTSLNVLASAAPVYGITAPYFVGHSITAAGGAFDEVELGSLNVIRGFHTNGMDGCVISSLKMRQRYQNTMRAQIQYMKKDVLDAVGSTLTVTFDGMPWITDNLCDNSEMFIIPKDKESLSCRWFRKPSTDTTGTEKGGRLDGFVKSSAAFAYEDDAWAACTIRAPGRMKIAKYTGVTS